MEMETPTKCYHYYSNFNLEEVENKLVSKWYKENNSLLAFLNSLITWKNNNHDISNLTWHLLAYTLLQLS